MQVVAVRAGNCACDILMLEVQGTQKVAEKTGIVAFEVAYVKRGVERPKVFREVEDLT
jgi:hypothetical protein